MDCRSAIACRFVVPQRNFMSNPTSQIHLSPSVAYPPPPPCSQSGHVCVGLRRPPDRAPHSRHGSDLGGYPAPTGAPSRRTRGAALGRPPLLPDRLQGTSVGMCVYVGG